MKKFVLILVAIILALYFISKCKYDRHPPSNDKVASEAANKAALNEIRKERKVKEVIITDTNVLYVSVIDDGSKRDGYASYFCIILSEMHSTVDRVKVVRFNSTNDPNRDNAYGVLLGESWCN